MSQRIDTDFILGVEPVETPTQKTRRELLEESINNFTIKELPNGSTVFTIQGDIVTKTTEILRGNGFVQREINLIDVVNEPL